MADPFVVIEQLIDAGSQFNGAEPTTTAVTADGIKKYPSGTVGGLFTMDMTSWWLSEVSRIAVDFGDAATKDIYIVDTTGHQTPIFSSIDPLVTKVLVTDKFDLGADEKIQVVTTGATAAMFCRVTTRPKLSRQA